MDQYGIDQLSEELFDEDEFVELTLKSTATPQGIQNGNYIKLYPYTVRDKKIFREVKNKEGKVSEVEVGDATLVDSVERGLENRFVSLVLKFYSFDRWEFATIEREKFVKSELKSFLKLGMDIIGKKADDVFAFIDKHEKVAPVSYSHNKLGWFIHDGELIFRLNQAYRKDIIPISKYKGPLLIEPKGSITVWLDAVKNHIIGHTPMEFILAASFAAPIVGLLNVTEISEVDSLMINMVGNTTTGKTTAAVVAASLYGSPSITNNGLIQSFNATPNALQNIISGNMGVVLIFDETSMNPLDKKSSTSFIYKLAQNKDKARLNQEAELKSTARWATVIMFTGEASLLENANANEGLYVRLFEFKKVQWTKSAEHSDSLKDIMLNNYGHAGNKYVQHLLTKEPEEIKGIWQGFKKDLERQLPDSNVVSRVGGKFALILTGAYLANEAFGINLSLENITEFLIAQEEASMGKRGLGIKFYQALLEYIIQNKRNFKYKNEEANPNQKIYGKIEVKNGKSLCYILKDSLKEIAKELGFPDLEVLLEELKKEGFLKHDKDKNQTKKQVFSKNEMDLREKILPNKKPPLRGDYTNCIVYDGDIFEGFYTSEEDRDRNLKEFDPNNVPKNRKVKPNTHSGSSMLFDED
ncbi:DUF927 domain-containing protein [Neobacillus sp. MER 74]|uniref:DUF927 domain-containing protein n=1 Tax=Neobacillus sp. MER 74 TaxID=2939566 RepID=UPI00203F3943|nr:DUF927 domain-containing protein [Neobacillus sp. MER 74]MCM3116312.1 DUF927 domain-containing protein [Neobacillus sp. MER 74]